MEYELLCEKIERAMWEYNTFITTNDSLADDDFEAFRNRSMNLLDRYSQLCDIRDRYEENRSVNILLEILSLN